MRLKEESTRQLERLYEQSNGNQELLDALITELQQRPSQQAQSLLAEIQVELFQLQEGMGDESIDWDDIIAQRQTKQTDDPDISPAHSIHLKRLLDSWMIQETLSPQVFQSAETLASRGTLVDITEEVPWFAADKPKFDARKSTYYQVFLGDIDVGFSQEQLLDLYGRQPESSKSPGFTVLAVATFNDQGFLAGDYGVGVGCFGWSYGRAMLKKIHHLPFWQNAERLLIRKLRKRFSPVDEYQRPRPVTFADLQEAHQWLQQNLQIPEEEVSPLRFGVRISQTSGLNPPRSPLLNSFILADLWRAREHIDKERMSGPLQAFLQTDEVKKNSLDAIQQDLKSFLTAEQMPPSRWPQDENQSLDALQQAAVNLGLSGATPLFSVHGPPGTGKTTLLRDIIAGVLCQRADALAAFENPHQAFMQSTPVRFGDQRCEIHHLHESLLGHEILVCSRNNKAVENISLELPMSKEINQTSSDLDFFAQTMEAYLQYKNQNEHHSSSETSETRTTEKQPVQMSLFEEDESSYEVETWGLIAAALGNSKNKKAYIQSVWLDPNHGLRRYCDLLKDMWFADSDYNQSQFYEFLPQSEEDALAQWENARQHFIQARQKADSAIQEYTTSLGEISQTFSLPVSTALNQLRDAVFKASLELQKAFVIAVAPKLADNLYGYFRVLAGAKGSRPELLPYLWASGSLITPVISSTFASIHSMLNDLPAETIGWLLIDEAGQASPQDAVGALMRAQRAIVVGDPQQIEPVVTIPNALVQGVSRLNKIKASDWMAPDISVQSIADRVNPFGIYNSKFKNSKVIGWPMFVHRRCAEPMFSMVNQMAYEGNMVQSSRHKGKAIWFDVQDISQDKWSHLEGEVCVDKVMALLSWKKKSISIITPFRHCAKSLRQRFRKDKKKLIQFGIQNPSQWINENIGTVHTFQGRQSEYVFFVLGAQAEDELPARDWATRKVNLCNVAVSRAQKGLFIIGNKALWEHQGVMRFISQACH